MKNKNLASRLDEKFLGTHLVPYSNCCGTCKQNKFEFVRDYTFSIRLYLNGMNYRPIVSKVYADYDPDLSVDRLKAEVKLIEMWAEVLGVRIKEIKWPESIEESIEISFSEHLILEP